MQKGMNRTQAAIEAAAVPAWPLLGATVIAVMAFYPIYASTRVAGRVLQVAVPSRGDRIAAQLGLIGDHHTADVHLVAA